ncbi:MAG: M15 family metallopeptidase [Tannerella sp.]|jgi:D-alanyl-D-alanine dipeptidase|nr:M15 family metallopeptidase [Tannerella sp.]
MRFVTVFVIVLFAACNGFAQKPAAAPTKKAATEEYNWDAKMKSMGFYDVSFWEPSIQYYLVYATKDNFTGKPLYNSKLTKAWLHPKAAMMLINAQDRLRKERPDLSLLVYDAARPIEVQKRIAEWAKVTGNDYYVADPSKGGGLHNYGLAVDVTLVDNDGQWLSMGTPYDFFGPEAHTDNEDDLLKRRRITPGELKNRKLLRRVMEEAGFRHVASEWWHFNACTREEAVAKYVLIKQ